MKTPSNLFKIFLSLFVVCYFLLPAKAQSPQKFNYQAVCRDSLGSIINNQTVTLRFNIIDLVPGGSSLYQETHTVVTNTFGLVNVEVGGGTYVSGDFLTIPWATGEKYMQIELNTGAGFVMVGEPQILSVPYALYANQSGTPGPQGVTGPTGVNGLDGAIGVTGPIGLTGPTGITGPTGQDGALNAWSLTGNAGTVDGLNFIGTTDYIPLSIRVNNETAGRIDFLGSTFFGYWAGNSNSGSLNTGIGSGSLYFNNTGVYNTATGSGALYSNTTGNLNTAIGVNALWSNKGNSQSTAVGAESMYYANDQVTGTETYNTAVGFQSLMGGTTASGNTGRYNSALGCKALNANTTGGFNVANGAFALYTNNTGSYNTASGAYALLYNTKGTENTANGRYAMMNNTTAGRNIAIGNEALFTQSFSNSGFEWNSDNVAMGYKALYSNQPTSTGTGIYNTAIGNESLYANTIGNANTAVGGQALTSNNIGNYNTANGGSALAANTSGSYNTAFGYTAGFAGSNHSQCTFIGANTSLATVRTNVTLLGYNIVDAQVTGNNQVCIGNTAIAAGGLRAAVTGWTAYSDGRFKTNVEENVAGLDFILKLNPVTYNVNPKELHKIWGTPDSVVNNMDFSEAEKETRIGFVAQDVERAAKECGFSFPGIDVPRNDTEVYTLRYVDFIMPMVKSIQEQQDLIVTLQQANEALKKSNENQQKINNDLQQQIDDLRKLIQK